MIRKFFRAGLVCLGFFGLTIPSPVLANIEAVGTPLVEPTIRQYQAAFTAATGIRASYVNSLEDISTSELFVGIYDLAVVEYPSSADRLQQLGLFQFPLFGFGVAVVVNVPGVPAESLRLNGAVLAAIYMGRINRWNDPRIAEINPGLNLPALPIVPVAQSDGSVATLNFMRYLADASAEWRRDIGIGSGLIWPLGEGEKDSRAAAQKVLETEGALGFQPTMNLATFNLKATQLQNAQGHYVKLSNTGVRQAFESFTSQNRPITMAPVNVSAGDAWPIVSIVYGQMKLVPEDIPDAVETVEFLTWAIKNANNLDTQPGLLPVSYEVVAPALNSMVTKKTYDGHAVKKGGGS
jgi:phosphate transport system substrate-binding protein